MKNAFDPVAAKARLLELVRERAYKDGIDIVLASGKRSDFYINGKKVSLHPEGLYLIGMLLLEKLERYLGALIFRVGEDRTDVETAAMPAMAALDTTTLGTPTS